MDHHGLDYTLQFDSEHKVLLITLGRLVTKATTLAMYHASLRMADVTGPCLGIADFSAVEKSELTARFMRSLSKLIPTFSAGGLRIFVATPSLYLDRMFQMLQTGGSAIQVVKSLDGAFDLLRLDSPRFRLIELH